MTQSKRSRWVTRGAFTAIACAVVVMFSAEQAEAQYYGGRGFSSGFNRGGVSFSFGNSGFNRGFSSSRGFSGRSFNSFNSGFRYVPQRSYYRGGYGGGYGRGYSPRYYGRRY